MLCIYAYQNIRAMRICVYVCMCVCVHACACIHISVYIHINIYIYILCICAPRRVPRPSRSRRMCRRSLMMTSRRYFATRCNELHYTAAHCSAL